MDRIYSNDTTTLRARALLLTGAAEAYGSPLARPTEAPCTVCGCASPAAEFAECGRTDCPVEGAAPSRRGQA